MSGLNRAVLFAWLVLQSICVSQAFAQQGNWSTGLGPVLSDTLLNSALQHANIARQHETRGEFGPALGQYEQVINEASQAAQQDTGGLREANARYVLGLAAIDHARTFVNLQVEHLFSSEYLTDLMRADQELRTAISIYELHGIQTWPAYEALALAQTLSGDLASAQASTQQAQTRNPQDESARTAGLLLADPPPQVAQAAAAVRSKHSITREQVILFANLAEIPLSRFGKTGSMIIGGIEVLKVIMAARHP